MDCMIGRVKPAIPRGEVGEVGDVGDLGAAGTAPPPVAGTCWCSVDAVLTVSL